MRTIIVAVLVACAGRGHEIPSDPYCSERGTFCAEVGDECEAGTFCGAGAAWCNAGRCEPFCSPVDYPHCKSGVETWSRDGSSQLCVCVQ